MPKKKFIPKKFQSDESDEELSEQDKIELQNFKNGKNLKINDSINQPEKYVNKPVQQLPKKKISSIKSNQKNLNKHKENRSPQFQRNDNKSKQQQNPDRNLNISILNSRKKKRNITTGLLKLPFQRLIKHITQQEAQRREDFQEGQLHYRYTREAISLLQCNAEGYLIEIFQDSYLLTNHAKRVTLMNRDLFLARRIRGTQLNKN